MNPTEYLNALIVGHENSSIPVQLSELKMLQVILQATKPQQVEQSHAQVRDAALINALELTTNNLSSLLAGNPRAEKHTKDIIKIAESALAPYNKIGEDHWLKIMVEGTQSHAPSQSDAKDALLVLAKEALDTCSHRFSDGHMWFDMDLVKEAIAAMAKEPTK